jgi:hypothetical protein
VRKFCFSTLKRKIRGANARSRKAKSGKAFALPLNCEAVRFLLNLETAVLHFTSEKVMEFVGHFVNAYIVEICTALKALFFE